MITEKELIEELKISRTTLWRLKKSGMPYLKVGSSYRYDKNEILNWIKNYTADDSEDNKISESLALQFYNSDVEIYPPHIKYREIKIPLNNPTTKDLDVINSISQQIKKEDMYLEISNNLLTVYLNQVDLNRLKGLNSNNGIVHKIIERIEAIKSYGIKDKKRVYVDYNKERKVLNRKQKEENRGKYFYTSGNNYSKYNNEIPEQFTNKIICGDSEEILKKLPDNCIDLIFTSPPYNFGLEYKNHKDGHYWKEYFDKLFRIFEQCIRILKHGGRIVINIQPLFSDYIPTHHIISDFFIRHKMIWKGEILWEKNNYNCKYTAWGSWKSPSNPYLKYTWEFLEIYCKGNLKKAGNNANIDIAAEEFKSWVVAKWSIAPERDMKRYGHPAMFPEELVKRVLKLFSYKDDIILDPFNGVGTTTAIAKNLGRRFLGIDIASEYCKKALKRLALT
jgi:DNA modification methylase/predicted DNA-binding transcriptional regulator AlpA